MNFFKTNFQDFSNYCTIQNCLSMLSLELQLSGQLCFEKKIINIFFHKSLFLIFDPLSKCAQKCLADITLHEDACTDVSAFLAKYFLGGI